MILVLKLKKKIKKKKGKYSRYLCLDSRSQLQKLNEKISNFHSFIKKIVNCINFYFKTKKNYSYLKIQALCNDSERKSVS